jgi:hypothetical protein
LGTSSNIRIYTSKNQSIHCLVRYFIHIQ